MSPRDFKLPTQVGKVVKNFQSSYESSDQLQLMHALLARPR